MDIQNDKQIQERKFELTQKAQLKAVKQSERLQIKLSEIKAQEGKETIFDALEREVKIDEFKERVENGDEQPDFGDHDVCDDECSSDQDLNAKSMGSDEEDEEPAPSKKQLSRSVIEAQGK